MSELTDKQEKFAQAVAAGKTYADAYREAYPVSEKWKDESIWCESSKLMADPKVLQRVKQIQEQRAKANEVTLEEVIKELSEWLRFDPIEFFDEENCMKNIHDLSPVARKQIADIKIQELWGKGMDGERVKIGEVKNIKFLDKQATADKFMRYFGAYLTNLKFSVDDLTHIKDVIEGIK